MKLPLSAALLCLLVSAPARAQEVEVGTAVICDTQKQVELFVTLLPDNAESAVSAVNAEEKSDSACGMSKYAFLRGSRIALVYNQDETFEIVKILVVGVALQGKVQAVVPSIFFSVFKLDERPA